MHTHDPARAGKVCGYQARPDLPTLGDAPRALTRLVGGGMICTMKEGWQQKAIERMKDVLAADEDVRGLVLIGSYTRDDIRTDIWSDVDIVIAISDNALARFYPATDWTSAIGEPYCFSQWSTKDYRVTRVYLMDGSRLDFVIATESSLTTIEAWEDNPLRYTNTCLFSRSPALDRALSMHFSPPILKPISSEEFDRMVNDFRFKGMLAVRRSPALSCLSLFISAST